MSKFCCEQMFEKKVFHNIEIRQLSKTFYKYKMHLLNFLQWYVICSATLAEQT